MGLVSSQTYTKVNSSRVGGTPLNQHHLYPGPEVAVPVPAAAHTTAIAALHAAVRHNNATIAGSGRMILTVDVGHGPVALLVLFNDPNFAHRPLDVRWDVCKVEAAAA